MGANRNQIAPCNGIDLAGTPITGTGAKAWVTVPNGKIFTLQPVLNGASGDCDVDIEACVIGGEATPETIASFIPTDTDMVTVPNVAYDRIRINVTSFNSPAGDDSDVLLSVRA